jgi:glycosyltransferase involved in cell wall biosynthesis
MLSAFLITRNEAHDITACLESLRGLADEIVVVDDHSIDETRTICERFGARVLQRRLDGFGAQKQFALEQTKGDWVLSIDADERVTPGLGVEIKAAVSGPTADGFQLRRQMYFLGQALRHGGVGRDWVLRLFRKSAGRFTTAAVHEHVQINGRVGQLSEALLHYSYDSLEEYLDKSNHYTTLAAEALFQKGRRFRLSDHLRPFWEIFARVALKGAWLDGRPGIVYAALSAHAAWIRSVKLWALEKKIKRS